MRDNRGTTIKVDDQVVYNFSGELALGTVLAIVEGVYEPSGYGWVRCLKKPAIKIARKFPTRESYGRRSNSFVSTVTNPKNVMVIHEH